MLAPCAVVATRAPVLVVINLRYWFHTFLIVESCFLMRFERTGAKKPRVVRFDHWGAANCGLQLGEVNEPLYRPPAPAGSANRRVDQFHPSSCTAVSVLVQFRSAISGVSPYRRERSGYEYFFKLIIARAVLSEIRAGQSEGS